MDPESFFQGVLLVIAALGGRDMLKYYINRRWPTIPGKCGSEACNKHVRSEMEKELTKDHTLTPGLGLK